jgi:hypothetical protein
MGWAELAAVGIRCEAAASAMGLASLLVQVEP